MSSTNTATVVPPRRVPYGSVALRVDVAVSSTTDVRLKLRRKAPRVASAEHAATSRRGVLWWRRAAQKNGGGSKREPKPAKTLARLERSTTTDRRRLRQMPPTGMTPHELLRWNPAGRGNFANASATPTESAGRTRRHADTAAGVGVTPWLSDTPRYATAPTDATNNASA